MTRQGLGDKACGLMQVHSQWTILHASQVLLVSLALFVVVLNILVFVYYDFYEITFSLLLLLLSLLYAYLQNGKTIKEEEELFDVLLNFPLTPSETMGDYHL